MKQINHRSTLGAAALAAVGLACSAHAQHADIEVFNDNGTLVVLDGPLFEGNFGDEGAAFTTINPGFASEPDEVDDLGFLTIPDGEEISFNVLKELFYWDGSSVAAVPTDHFVRLQQGSTLDLRVDIDGTTGFQTGYVFGEEGEAVNSMADPEPGGFHSHITYELLQGAGPAAGDVAGAYGFVLELEGSTLDTSDRFGVLLNFGLEEDDFENGVSSFAAFIPEPTALAITGIGGLMLLARRRKQQA
ncbi:MAG: PEP-CTERM sorting domain-containing protein [Planctomycetota bacterium]